MPQRPILDKVPPDQLAYGLGIPYNTWAELPDKVIDAFYRGTLTMEQLITATDKAKADADKFKYPGIDF